MDDPNIQANGRTWTQDQEWERAWHSTCENTFSEEAKGITYAHRMGLVNEPDPYTGAWPSFDLQGRSVLDIGGGPHSLLLKCRNRGPACTVLDPCEYPDWVSARYAHSGIRWWKAPAEVAIRSSRLGEWDEVWAYNFGQHCTDPEVVFRAARALAPVMRVFEWIDAGVTAGHPSNLTAADLNDWVGGVGTVEQMNENGCVGPAWYGTFTTPVILPRQVTHVAMPTVDPGPAVPAILREFGFRDSTTTPAAQ